MPQTRFELLIATSNAGKIRELSQMLSRLPITLRSLNEFPDVTPVDEVGNTYEENAVLKALGYSEQTGLYALADDSGLEVAALGGMPGVLSARFGGETASDSDRTDKLLRTIATQENSNRTARFVCCVAVAGWPRDGAMKGRPCVLNISDGKCEGTIAKEATGSRGFGYDPVFIPNGYDASFGELPEDVKSNISHRSKALLKVRRFLDQFLTSA